MTIYIELLVCAYIVDIASSGAVFRGQDADDDNEVSSYDFPYVTRSMWHARPPKEKIPLQSPVPYVVIHHSYSPPACYDGVTCRQAMRSMQNFHMDSRGWWDIGYNFAVGSDGAAYEGRGWTVLGAHALHFNNISIGICLIGDWRFLVPPSNQLKSAKALINAGVELGYIKSDYKLVGHRQVRETECPGDALFHEIQTWDHWSSFPASYKDLDKIDLTGSQNKS
ncbi:peptidoglycan-recognition protein LB-like [Danaus plexippus]|nr:peptidoglycan-recognition protein LB-like [Danaus plexippus]